MDSVNTICFLWCMFNCFSAEKEFLKEHVLKCCYDYLQWESYFIETNVQ